MTISNDHLTGFVMGVAAAAAGYYLYRQNQAQVDEFLRSQGIPVPVLPGPKDPAQMSLEELVREKERFEDLIAEREGLTRA